MRPLGFLWGSLALAHRSLGLASGGNSGALILATAAKLVGLISRHSDCQAGWPTLNWLDRPTRRLAGRLAGWLAADWLTLAPRSRPLGSSLPLAGRARCLGRLRLSADAKSAPASRAGPSAQARSPARTSSRWAPKRASRRARRNRALAAAGALGAPLCAGPARQPAAGSSRLRAAQPARPESWRSRAS